MARREVSLPDGYPEFLGALKRRVRVAQGRAHRAVNTQLIELYWSLGRAILTEQEEQGWGAGVIDRLAQDLQREFPNMTGLSRSNLFYMRALATAWPADSKVPQLVGLLPWGHIRLILDKLNDASTRDGYVAAAVKNGWSRDVLLNQIKNRTLERSGSAPSNFNAELTPADSELAKQLSKDPYVFDFLELTEDAAERDLEQALMDRIVDTLRELGTGFAFVGRQVHFDVGGDDFYLDLLFFHIDQMRYVVIELKTGKFQPEHAGKLGFYVSLVDDRLRREGHAPTVGILICGDRNDHTVRYALGRSGSPMAVSTYTYDSLPPSEKNALPAADELTAAFGWADEEQGKHG
ncbi:PDDEXK nuclease domain-containing protein [Cryobacterium roopkundense]|uniref:Putative nuclease of restriction endonuclease-like (RecB) superfamily n=1 Tax=Cryobacterium roopkundense TaxID=1001240 RepID=A0A7W9A0P1_9MICO|nr:PDDEXK nuclease domain-containing protein [Cryobacterium roopkundense]MBB5643694.1 putative nuclease of restriction endonuclease-like (RecB) superfamily [Cryobacterium roopkundense]